MEAKVKEGRFIDYKRNLPSTKDSDVKNLLADVSAFANSSGGTILFGIEEDEGEPTVVTGIGSIDAKAVERLSNIIGNSLDPPLRGFDFDLIETKEGKRVLVLRIKQSPSAPHMLNYKGSQKFYSRGVAGNVPMGSYEIRAAF
jgi:predicted HTH transcriptional regulator